MYEYSNDSQGVFPMTKCDNASITCANSAGWDVNVLPSAEENVHDNVTVMPWGSAAATADRTVSSNLWILCRLDFCQPDIFRCPSASDDDVIPILLDNVTAGTDNVGAKCFRDFPFFDRNETADGPAKGTIHYSFVQPWTVYNRRFSSADLWGTEPPVDSAVVVIGGDQNNGVNPAVSTLIRADNTTDMKVVRDYGNSRNHVGEGQNLLYGDGHTEFQKTCFAGMAEDNVYSSRRGATDETVTRIPGARDVRPSAYPGCGDNWDTVLIPVKDAVLNHATYGWAKICN